MLAENGVKVNKQMLIVFFVLAMHFLNCASQQSFFKRILTV